jgi:hypothetical protein
MVFRAGRRTDVGLLLGEMLPFYATIFILAWNGAFAVGAREPSSAARGSEPARGSSSQSAD